MIESKRIFQLIQQTMIISTKFATNPSSKSSIVEGRVLSITPRSFAHLFINRQSLLLEQK